MKRTILAALVTVALVAVALAAACGDGPDTPAPTAQPTPTEPAPVATPTPTAVQPGPAAPTPPPIEGEGRLVFISDHTGNNEVWTVNPDGSDLQQLTDTPEQEASAYWSPDGTRIGFTRFSEADGVSFHVMDADGTNERASDERTLQAWVDRLTQSRDGSVRIGDGTVVDGSGEVLLEFDFPGDAVGDVMVMSPDGTRIVVGLAVDIFQGVPQDEVERIIEEQDQAALLALAETEFQVVIIDVATGETRPVTQRLGRDWLPVWGPDGHQIAYLSRTSASAPAGIYRIDADGDNPAEIFPAPDCENCVGVSRVQWQR